MAIVSCEGWSIGREVERKGLGVDVADIGAGRG